MTYQKPDMTINRLADLGLKTVAVALMALGTLFWLAVTLAILILPFVPYHDS